MKFAIDFDGVVAEQDRPYDDVTTPLKFVPGAREGLQALRRAGHLLVLWSGRASRALLADPELDPLVQAGAVRSNREAWLSSRAVHLARYEQMIRFVEEELPEIFDAVDDGTAGKPLVDVILDDKAMKFGRSSGGLGWSTIAQFYGERSSPVEEAAPEKAAQVISLDTPVAELEHVPTSRLQTILDTVRVELRSAGITRFEPVFALGDSGFWCADRALTINIPWFLATPELYGLAQQRYPMKWLDVARGVRHEVGHAINYTFEIWKRADWTELFGDFRLPYPEREGSWPVELGSPDFVEYVRDSGPGYGQRHPDDDWAETFACWLDPTSDLTQFREGALRKLQYVEFIAREVLAGFPVNNDLGVPKQWRAAFPGQTVREALFQSAPAKSTAIPSKAAGTGREGLIAVEREVTRGESTFKQTYWIRPEDKKETDRQLSHEEATAVADAPRVFKSENLRDIDAVEKYSKEKAKDWVSSLGDYEREQILLYTQNGYKNINWELRFSGEETRMSLETRIATKYIDSALERAAIPEPILVHRGGFAEEARLVPGARFSDKGYVSTTMLEHVTHDFIPIRERAAEMKAEGVTPVQWHIKLPKGAHAAIADGASGHPREGEVLLPRGSSFRIESVTRGKVDGKDVHIVEAVLETP